jgi:Cu2+-exporting ATPase
MVMSSCRLCDLPTPDPPITASAVDGEFCCRGCLEVARSLDDVPDGDLEARAQETAAVDDIEETVPDDAEAVYLSVDGMHCTTCEAFLFLRGEDTDGVYAIEANYGLETARVFYDPDAVDPADLPERLSGRGYRFGFPDESDGSAARTRQRDTAQRLVIGAFLSMLVMPWYFVYLYPSYVGIETGVLQVDATTPLTFYAPLVVIAVMTTGVLFYSGAPILRGAWVSLRTRHLNMDLLVAIAASAAYVYSTVALATGDTHLYYDVTVAIIMIVTLGRYYEGAIRSQATSLLSDITTARAREATRLTDDGRETVAIDALEPGHEVVVTPGERVPVDGTVREGVAAVDESVVTGESIPVTKEPGDDVVGGSVVTDDALVVAVGPDVESTADRIARALWEIQSATPGVQRLADAIATVFVPLVLVLGAGVTLWHLLTGSSVSTAVLSGLVVLIVSCPCAMGLATPLAISAGLRDGLRRGVVIANEVVFEVAPEADILVFDKTGTLTTGEMTVSTVVGDDRTLQYAAAVERYASHPVADAVLDSAMGDRPATDGGVLAVSEQPDPDGPGEARLPAVEEFTRHPGEGVSGVIDATAVVVGMPELVTERVGPIPESLADHIESFEASGEIPVVVGWDGRVRGVLAVGDELREEWEQAVEGFEAQEVTVLTGDDGQSADQFRDHPAVDSVFAGVPPDGKVETIRRLSAEGTTVMVGDGTNDAPALAAADLGIAMGDGTARAIDAADVVVTDNDLTAVETVFEFVRGTRRRIRENIAWAFLYNAVALPLAVQGVLNPLFAAVAMAASSIIVVSNSKRSVL